MKSNTTTILVAVGALLVGGVATAAFLKHGDSPAASNAVATPNELQAVQDNGDAAGLDTAIPTNGLQYADVVKVEPVTKGEPQYATVIGTEPVRETTTTTTPHEVCEDVVVQERLPEKDGNVGGTVAGAIIGGVLGNQVGGGNGRKVATAAGAAAGGYIGNRVDRSKENGQIVSRTERQCHTEQATSESSRVTGYNVTYRNADGSTGTMRMDKKPGTRIPMGSANKVVAYDVTYRFDGTEKTVRMDDKPDSDRLPVIDGQVVTRTEAAADNHG